MTICASSLRGNKSSPNPLVGERSQKAIKYQYYSLNKLRFSARLISSITMIYSFLLLNYETLLTVSTVFLIGIILRHRYNERSKPPLASEAMPLIGHTRVFLKDLTKLASIISYVRTQEL